MPEYLLLTATHSMMSVYLGCITIVLKLPLTSAASTKGLQRYKGLGVGGAGVVVLGLAGNESVELDGNVADVGVVDRFGGRGARVIERLSCMPLQPSTPAMDAKRTHPIELKKDIMLVLAYGKVNQGWNVENGRLRNVVL